MYVNAAYLKDTLIRPDTPADLEDSTPSLRVLCCGVYRIRSLPHLATERPNGRKDYQLLYFHSGQGHFYFGKNTASETIVHAGQMVLFCPGEAQIYHYYAADQPEVYWIHFTGNKVSDLLQHLKLPGQEAVFTSGVCLEYPDIFSQIITELQLKKACFEEISALLLRQLFLLIERNQKEHMNTCTNMQNEIRQAIRYFNKNYHTQILIREYAKEHFLSPCWFTRTFKQYTGCTPAQYLTSVRIASAQNLLENLSYSIHEIAAMVGYDDALYFSRTFKKHAGCSPKEYRQKSRLSSTH